MAPTLARIAARAQAARAAGEVVAEVALEGLAAPQASLAALGSADAASDPRDAAWCATHEGALTRRQPTQAWRFEGRCDDVFVDLASRAGDDMFLSLYARPIGEPTWRLQGWNDDCYAGTLDACLEVSTAAGVEYLAVATTYDYVARHRRTPASYHLQVACRTAGGACTAPGGGEPAACGSRGLDPCPEGEYCDWEESALCGAADAPGVCRARPDACIALYDPVCGCDGRTYGNACSAASSGVDVARSGACVGEGQGEGETCGGIAALRCAEGLHCDYSANEGCLIADVAGVCARDDEALVCMPEYAPVCGCDGVTYANDCLRRAAGMALDHAGECYLAGRELGQLCGGLLGATCRDHLVCDYSDSFCGLDAPGVCADAATISCTAAYAPVCGCDGVTYANDCLRRAATVAVAHAGEC